jgi:hypothetical protein
MAKDMLMAGWALIILLTKYGLKHKTYGVLIMVSWAGAAGFGTVPPPQSVRTVLGVTDHTAPGSGKVVAKLQPHNLSRE